MEDSAAASSSCVKSHQTTESRSFPSEQPILLFRELLIRESPAVPQTFEAFELRGDVQRHTRARHPSTLVLLDLGMDDVLHAIRSANVEKELLSVLAR